MNPSIEDKEIRQTLAELRGKNADKGIYGGNGWANYAAQYFNDCVRFAEGAAWCLHSGATALAVIGNSILQGVPIPTDRFFAKIAEPYGFQVINIHVSRDTRVGNSIVNSSVRVGKDERQRTPGIRCGVEACVMPDLWDPLTYDNLMAGTVVHFEKQNRCPLNEAIYGEGPGIYALYYGGRLAEYSPISGTERPIYVGQGSAAGDPKGLGKGEHRAPGIADKIAETFPFH